MALLTFDDFINRIGGSFVLNEPFWGELSAAATSVFGTTQLSSSLVGDMKVLPNPLPSNVGAYIPTYVSFCASAIQTLLVARLIDLGSLDISTPTFTDGNAMPTVTELGVSRVMSSAVFAEVTTALNATPGSVTITYVDQDGNTAETTASHALNASATVKSTGQFTLNSTDTGVQDITSATRTGGTTPTGVLQFWGLVPIAMFSIPAANTVGVESLIGAAFNPIRLPAGARIGMFPLGSVSTQAMLGNIMFVGDTT